MLRLFLPFPVHPCIHLYLCLLIPRFSSSLPHLLISLFSLFTPFAFIPVPFIFLTSFFPCPFPISLSPYLSLSSCIFYISPLTFLALLITITAYLFHLYSFHIPSLSFLILIFLHHLMLSSSLPLPSRINFLISILPHFPLPYSFPLLISSFLNPYSPLLPHSFHIFPSHFSCHSHHFSSSSSSPFLLSSLSVISHPRSLLGPSLRHIQVRVWGGGADTGTDLRCPVACPCTSHRSWCMAIPHLIICNDPRLGPVGACN